MVFHGLVSKASRWLQIPCDLAHQHNSSLPLSKHNNTPVTTQDHRSNSRVLSAPALAHYVGYSVNKAKLQYHAVAVFLDPEDVVRVIRTSRANRTNRKVKVSAFRAKARANFPEGVVLEEVKVVVVKAELRIFKLLICQTSKGRAVLAVVAEA